MTGLHFLSLAVARRTVAVAGLLALGAVPLVACGSGSSAPTDVASLPDAGAVDSAPPPPATCAADQHRNDAGACDSAITWTGGPDLATPRDHHATFLADPGGTAARFLYVAGGFTQTSNDLLTDIVRAPVADDGTLGAWESGGSLPIGIAGASVIVTHGKIVLAGGYAAKTTWSATIAADGSLGPWKAGPTLAGTRFHAVGVAYQDFIYVIGGIAGNNTVDEVARSSIGADGELSPFEIVAHLPITLSHQIAVVDGSTLYVVDGQTGNTNDNSGTPRKSTFMATLAADGSLSPWVDGPATPYAYETASGVLHDGFLYMFGGIINATSDEAGGIATTDVLRVRVTGPGQLDRWTRDDASKLPKPFSHVHQAPVFGNHVYLVSGLDGTLGNQKDVRVGAFH